MQRYSALYQYIITDDFEHLFEAGCKNERTAEVSFYFSSLFVTQKAT